MGVPVNPPPALRLPQQFQRDPIVRDYFKQQNTILFQLWNRTGGSSDISDQLLALIQANKIAIEQNAEDIADNRADIDQNTEDIAELQNYSSNAFNTQMQFLQQQITGLPVFTIDTSGFTTDTSLITTDKVIA